MKWLVILLFFQFIPYLAICQLAEDFSDGDLGANPAWTFNGNDWLTNSAFQLQSNHPTTNSNFSITTPQTLATIVQWEFYVRLSFNPSSANFIDVFLVSTSADLISTGNLGYFVRLGNTQDEISLYRKDATGIVKIIDGVDGVLNSSENSVRVRVSRNAQNLFILDRDLSASGNQFVSEGSAIDGQYQVSAYFGILARQSTSSFFNKHYIDDVVISQYIPDTLPPSIISVHAISPNTLEVKFDEAIAQGTSLLTANFFADPGLGNPQQISHNDAQTLSIIFAQNFSNGTLYNLHIQNIQDLSGNSMSSSTHAFEYYNAQRNDVVLHEIMVDPGPPVGLPNAEFLEIKNRCGKPVNVQGWKLVTASMESGELPSLFLQPDSLLIICSVANVPLFQTYGRTIGIPSYPAFANNEGMIAMMSKEGKTIHAIEYSDQWYGNALKKEGGWTLEMIDLNNPCTGKNNWKASENISGGTPGKINSVSASNPDDNSPELLRSYALDSIHLVAVFNEPLDSLTATNISSFQLSPGIIIDAANPIAPLFKEVKLKLPVPMENKKIYTLRVTGLKDCLNNSIGTNQEVKAGMFSIPASNDVVVNEILFNPRSNGYDYVELLNRSNNVFDLSQLYLANRNATSTLSSITKLAEKPYALFPGDHAVFTESTNAISLQYHVKFPEKCFETSLPSYADDTGQVVLLDNQGIILDEAGYSDKLHFPLLKDKEGVSLERIDPDDSSATQHNWQSAAFSAGFGTPGYINSQYRQNETMIAAIEPVPKIFSPDMDGHDDFLMLKYHVAENGYMMNSTVFDAGGRMVRLLVKNTLLGTKGSFRWDGLDEKHLKLPMGNYIILTEIFNLQGKKGRFKNVVVIAGSY